MTMRRLLALSGLLVAMVMLIAACSSDEDGDSGGADVAPPSGGQSSSTPPSDRQSSSAQPSGETEFRQLSWQGLDDFVGSNILWYIADEGVDEPSGPLFTTKVDGDGQASYRGNVHAISGEKGQLFYYIDADENGVCTRLSEPSGVKEFFPTQIRVIAQFGVQGNIRDMQCEGLQP